MSTLHSAVTTFLRFTRAKPLRAVGDRPTNDRKSGSVSFPTPHTTHARVDRMHRNRVNTYGTPYYGIPKCISSSTDPGTRSNESDSQIYPSRGERLRGW